MIWASFCLKQEVPQLPTSPLCKVWVRPSLHLKYRGHFMAMIFHKWQNVNFSYDFLVSQNWSQHGWQFCCLHKILQLFCHLLFLQSFLQIHWKLCQGNDWWSIPCMEVLDTLLDWLRELLKDIQVLACTGCFHIVSHRLSQPVWLQVCNYPKLANS